MPDKKTDSESKFTSNLDQDIEDGFVEIEDADDEDDDSDEETEE